MLRRCSTTSTFTAPVCVSASSPVSNLLWTTLVVFPVLVLSRCRISSHPTLPSGSARPRSVRLLATRRTQRQDSEVKKSGKAGEGIRHPRTGRISWTARWTKPSEQRSTWKARRDACLARWGPGCTTSSCCSLLWWHSWVKDRRQADLQSN